MFALIVFGIVALFVSIPNENITYAVAGLGIALELFGGDRRD